MGSTYIRNVRVIDFGLKYPERAGMQGWDAHLYAAVADFAENNVIPIHYSPNLVKIGEEWEVMQEACEYAKEIVSGMLKPNGKWGSPEAFITRMREEIKKAKPGLVTLSIKKKDNTSERFEVSDSTTAREYEESERQAKKNETLYYTRIDYVTEVTP
jgi:hypothetical protein